MNRIIVVNNAQQRYRIILFGSRYALGGGRKGGPVDGFLKIGRDEEYDPEVSRDDGGEDEYVEYSES